ncbi:MAG: hypothetical protein HOW73_01030 [Polyangiaceae bacterium]|nr:hypothetical protein [Polyangiaceae bacterium]
MLTRELMGYVALWILWGNTFLVALAAAKRALSLLERTKWMRSAQAADGAVGVFRGAVASPGPLGELVVEQNGRHASGSSPAIVWHDRSVSSRVAAGAVKLDAGAQVELGSALAGAEVWLTPQEIERAARCESASAFEAAYAAARRVKGFARSAVASVGQGAIVYLAGRLGRSDDGREGFALGAYEGRLVVATIDPRAWAVRRAAIVLGGFVPAIFLCAAGCTALALTAPVFDSMTSKLGGLLGFVFFLLVLPAGTVVRDFMREPHQPIVRGRWTQVVATTEANVATARDEADADAQPTS